MDIVKLVNDFPSKHPEGLTNEELEQIKKNFPDLCQDSFNNAMMGNTCMMRDGDVINYHCDVVTALRCGIEKRKQRFSEWD